MTSKTGTSPNDDKAARDAVMALVRDNPDRLTRKDLARRLDIKGDGRRELRRVLRDMTENGLLTLSSRKTYREAGALPPVMVIRVTGLDAHGDMIGIPEPFKGEGEAPVLRIIEGPVPNKSKGHKSSATLGVGGRALCRIKTVDDEITAHVMKRLGDDGRRHMGILHKDGRGWAIKPVDKKARHTFRPLRLPADIQDQTLVMYRAAGRKNRLDKAAEILDVLGPADSPKAASLISLRQHNIAVGFSDAVIAEAEGLSLPTLSKTREDLRDIPLITIDPVDAKDFDDAVFAQPDDDPKNTDGWVIWVAIADVSAFVLPGSALDRAAEARGNSTYMPDRVEPMLPDALSSDLCSLRPQEDRACMAVRMRFDRDGNKVDHHFVRGLMRSHARLTYAQAQAGFDGKPGEAAAPVIDTLGHIFSAYKTLRKARKNRAPLAIELPERRVHVNDEGEVTGVTVRDRFDAHKLVEEFMVQANVAAAEALGRAGASAIVRVHEPPAREKLQGLADFLPVLGLKWSLGERPKTARFNRLLEQAREKDLTEAVGMAVLRSQSQAYYSPDPKGHFGLNLSDYAHFTSPIRRYADLVVHRALISAFGLGEGGTSEREASRLKEISEHISDTERRSMAAERDARDRYIARYMEGREGAEFDARITGVTSFGLFVTLDETGADGLILARDLDQEFYVFDEKSRALTGVESGNTYKFGRKVKIRLKQADGITGSLTFTMLTPPEPGKPPKRQSRKPRGGASGRSGGSHRKGRRRGR